MPNYDFRDKTTGVVFERTMKIAEKEIYLTDNPNIESYHTTINLGDPVRLGIRKVDGGFKDVLSRIHDRSPGSTLNTHSSHLY